VSSLILSLVVFVVVLAGAIIGAFLRNILSDRVLTADSKEVVKLGAGLIGTLAALVLGLMVAAAKGSYDTQNNDVRKIASDVMLLDLTLEHYGPEARGTRDLLRHALGPMVEQIWRENSSNAAMRVPFEATVAGNAAYDSIRQLSPQDEFRRGLKAQALDIATDLAKTRTLLFQEASQSIPTAFFVALVFWLAAMFVSFSLFTRVNAAVAVVLVVLALSFSGAIFLIQAMNDPFAGPLQISSAPLRNALQPLGPVVVTPPRPGPSSSADHDTLGGLPSGEVSLP
jgi:hypothetical protein